MESETRLVGSQFASNATNLSSMTRDDTGLSVSIYVKFKGDISTLSRSDTVH